MALEWLVGPPPGTPKYYNIFLGHPPGAPKRAILPQEWPKTGPSPRGALNLCSGAPAAASTASFLAQSSWHQIPATTFLSQYSQQNIPSTLILAQYSRHNIPGKIFPHSFRPAPA